jgi:hypothetical protein
LNQERPNPYRLDETPRPAAPSGSSKPRGCFFWGCLIVAVLGVFMTTCTVGGAYLTLRGFRDGYTEAQPRALAPVALSAEDTRSVRERVDEFRKELDAGTASERLVLDIDELNALLAEENRRESRLESIRLRFEDDQLRGEISMPLDGIPGLSGRYLNGSADVDVAFVDGNLSVHLDDIEVAGKPLPPAYAEAIRAENLAERAMRDSETRETLRRIASIDIQDGKVIVEPRGAGTTPPQL